MFEQFTPYEGNYFTWDRAKHYTEIVNEIEYLSPYERKELYDNVKNEYEKAVNSGKNQLRKRYHILLNKIDNAKFA